MDTELKDCAWCGLPMELVSVYDSPVPKLLGSPLPRQIVVTAQAKCLSGHWYGGPLEDLVL